MRKLFRNLMLVSLPMLVNALSTMAQTAEPTVSFYSVDDAEFVEMSEGESQSVQAPCEITCHANLEYDMSEYDMVVSEWRIYKSDEGEMKPLVDRYDEDITYTLTESGSYGIKYYATFINTAENDTVEYETESGFTIVVSESKLICTDGLSPNGDGINDKLHIETQSIVKVEGYILNRWGQKLHTFTLDNINDGWDGYYNGKVVKDGAYLLYIDAVGSDGLHYRIKKAINVMKGLRDNADSEGSY